MLNIELIKQIEDISLELRNVLGLPIIFENPSEFKQVTFDELSNKITTLFTSVDVICDMQSEHSYMKKMENKFEIHVGTDMAPEERIDCLMHEMAHVVLHADNLKTNSSIGKYTGTVNQENEANCFSRSFLIPTDFFIRALSFFSRNDGSVETKRMAIYFGVKESLIIERGRDLMIWN